MGDAERIATALLAIAEAIDGLATEVKWLGSGGMCVPGTRHRVAGMEYLADAIADELRKLNLDMTAPIK